MAGSGTAHLRGLDHSLLRAENLVVEFSAGYGKKVHAVSDVSFDVLEGETLGIVGESGCGKSTTGRALLQLPKPTSGKVWFDGEELTSLDSAGLRSQRTKMQMIFQDPVSSLYPRRSVADLVAEPLAIWGIGTPEERMERVRTMLGEVNMDFETVSWRHPYEFSIGQCQRISIARALMLNPKLVVCDEPVSALDVSVQAQILNLLEEMKKRYALTLVFISHDLAVVKNVSDRVLVMYLGKTCEVASATELYAAPTHPYTRALLMASVISSRALSRPGTLTLPEYDGLDTEEEVETEIPSSITPPSGCRYRTRCPRAEEICAMSEPVMRQVREDHFVACHFPINAPASAEAQEYAAAVAAAPAPAPAPSNPPAAEYAQAEPTNPEAPPTS